MKKGTETTVISFRVPKEIADRIDKAADEIKRGSRQKVVDKVFLPAFERYFKRHHQDKAAA
jgi:hypothetical protein